MIANCAKLLQTTSQWAQLGAYKDIYPSLAAYIQTHKLIDVFIMLHPGIVGLILHLGLVCLILYHVIPHPVVAMVTGKYDFIIWFYNRKIGMFIECLVINETIPVFCSVIFSIWHYGKIHLRNSNRSCVPGRAAGHSELARWTVRLCRCWPRISPCHMENP